MTTLEPPPEIVQEIFKEIGTDAKTANKAATLARDWLVQHRPMLLRSISFRDQEDVLTFFRLASAPSCTFPLPIPCRDLSFHGLTAMTNSEATTIGSVVPLISPPRSITLSILVGEIPQPMIKALAAWATGLWELTISGGTHSPETLFPALSSLPHLRKLTLQDFKLEPKEASWRQGDTYAFPMALKALCIVGDVSMFKFVKERVTQSGGFSSINSLSIQTRFLFENPGVPEMLDTIRTLNTIATITLRPTYDPTCRHLRQDMWDIFCSPSRPLLSIRGLESLQIDFSDTPAEWALNCLCMYANYLASRRKCLKVDIRVPRSLELWDEQGPAVQLEQLLEEVDHDIPRMKRPPKSTLVVRDFPADLPERFWAAPTICKFPVTFIDVGV